MSNDPKWLDDIAQAQVKPVIEWEEINVNDMTPPCYICRHPTLETTEVPINAVSSLENIWLCDPCLHTLSKIVNILMLYASKGARHADQF